jgi:hypothetical protein
MNENEKLTREEELAQCHERKKELLRTYHNYKEDLDYAMDDIEEGLIRNKREKLAREIKTLSAKIAELTTEESSA